MTLTIKSKILSGYGIILALLIIVAAVAYINLISIQEKLAEVVERSQPKAIVSLELSSKMNKSSSDLGYFMLSTDEKDKEAYLKSFNSAQESIKTLKSIVNDAHDNLATDAVNRIENLAGKLISYQDKMFDLASSREKNLPALKIATEELEPLGSKLLQLASDIVLSSPDTDDPIESSEIMLIAHDLRFHWAMVTSNVRSYLAYRDESVISNINLFKVGTRQLVEGLSDKEDALSEEQIDALDEFIELEERYYLSFNQAYGMHSGEQWRTDAFIVRTELGPLLNKIETELESLVVMQEASIERTSHELQAQVVRILTLLSLIVMVAVALAIIIAYLSATRIINPLRQAVIAMEDLASAEGDLTKRLDESGKDELGQLGAAFNLFITKVLSMVQSISSVGDNVKGSTLKLSAVADNTKQQMIQLQEEAHQVTIAVTQMSSSVHEVASSANATASATKKADDEANIGSEIVTDTIDVINQLNLQFVDSASKISQLNTECDNISNIIDVIKEIADTTNLLSLNAAIEAARAGESGRGFAVVADEVRNLASRTQNSTKEIQQSIERLQADSKSAVQAMDQGKLQVDVCVKKAAEAGKSLTTINEFVRTINNMNIQVASAAEEQNAVFTEISQNIDHICLSSDKISKEGAVTSTEGLHLESLSNELVDLVGHFKLEDTSLERKM